MIVKRQKSIRLLFARYFFGRLFMLSFLCILLSYPAQAFIQKKMQISGNAMCPFFTKDIQTPKGWTAELRNSCKDTIYALFPEGQTFDTAPSIIYVNILYNAKKETLDEFIQGDIESWTSKNPKAQMKQKEVIQTKNKDISFAIFEMDDKESKIQKYELVSFGEDKDKDGNKYFVIIVASGKSKKNVIDIEDIYRRIIAEYD